MIDDAYNRILEKINKCLSMAKSSNANEADIAWRQAKALMAQYNIGNKEVKASVAATARSDLGKRPGTWLVKLANTCGRAFCCKVITETSYRKEAVFIGIANNPDFAAYTFDVLHRQLKSDRKQFVSALSARCKLSSKRRQGEIFAEHWVNSVWSVIAKFAEFDDETTDIITAYIELQYPKITTTTLESRKVTKRDYGAANAGYRAGTNAKIHKAMDRDERPQLEFLAG